MSGRAAAVLLALAALLASTGASVFSSAAFSARTTNLANVLAAAPDWLAPAITAPLVLKAEGGTPGYVRPGGTFQVYANATDSGRPASGVSSLSADVSKLRTGTAPPLGAGSWSAGGTAYGYRSAAIVADAGLAAGTAAWSVTATDAAGNRASLAGPSVTIDGTAPSAYDISTINSATAGRPDAGDRLILTWTEPVEPQSIVTGWSGAAATNLVVRITDGGSNDDVLTFWSASGSTQLPLGSVALGRTDFVAATTSYGAAGTASTLAISGSTLTITLGTAAGLPTTASKAGTMSWAPSAASFDRAGNPASTATATERGTSDRDF